MDPWKRRFLLENTIFTGYVSLLGSVFSRKRIYKWWMLQYYWEIFGRYTLQETNTSHLTLPETNMAPETGWKMTLPKFNIAPEKWWLEDYSPIEKVTFQRLC